MAVLPPVPASAQKIIHIDPKPVFPSQKKHALKRKASHIRVRKYGRVHVPRGRIFRARKLSKKFPFKRNRFFAFALPEQRLFPPYYEAQRPWSERPGMESRLEGGKTVEQGSRWASHIEGGRTVEQGSAYRGHIRGGRTVEGGSVYASHIAGGKTVEQGSRWGSTMPNWRFSGYAAPVRPKGIPYYRATRRRSPWASRLR